MASLSGTSAASAFSLPCFASCQRSTLILPSCGSAARWSAGVPRTKVNFAALCCTQGLVSLSVYSTRVKRSGAERLRAVLPALQVLGVPA
jgi:hypothetical protein